MDKKLGSHLIVGIFVFVGFLLFLLLLMNIGSGTGIFSSKVTLYSKFAHVKGLHYGSEVSLSGLRIGTVKNITVGTDESKDLLVELAINHDAMKNIREDSVARVVTQGMLGDKYIEITIGSSEKPILKNGAFLISEELPDIITKSGGLVEGITKQFNKGGEIDNLLKNINHLTLNLIQITNEIKNSKGTYKELVSGTSGDKLKSSLTKIDSILGKIESGEGTLGALVNDPSVYEDLKNLLGGAKRSNILKYFMRSYIEEGEKASKEAPPKK